MGYDIPDTGVYAGSLRGWPPVPSGSNLGQVTTSGQPKLREQPEGETEPAASETEDCGRRLKEASPVLTDHAGWNRKARRLACGK